MQQKKIGGIIILFMTFSSNVLAMYRVQTQLAHAPDLF